MIIINTDPKPYFTILLAYAMACRIFRCTTLEVDKKIKAYAEENQISIIVAFEEWMEIALDLDCCRHLKEQTIYDSTFGY